MAGTMKLWTVEQIQWDQFDGSKVDPDILQVIKAAALVEYNGGDYAHYLRGVFHDDEAFRSVALDWAEEEVQHGRALGRWAELADSDFDFPDAVRRFNEGYKIPQGLAESVRGSRTGELVARCIVESGTSSFYSALRDATDEPVLKEICGKIAGDEFRHYKLFYTHLQRYMGSESVSRLDRVRVAVSRIVESEDDELPMAYHCANENGLAYDRSRCAQAYAGRAYRLYRHAHCRRAVGMILKAAGLDPQGWLGRLGTWLFWTFLQRRALAAEQTQAA
jgi:rubrerythrin